MNAAEEHVLVRRFLQRLGSSHVYQRGTIQGEFHHEPVKIVTGRVRGPVAAPSAGRTPGPDALAFAFLGQPGAAVGPSGAAGEPGDPGTGHTAELAAPAIVPTRKYRRIFSYYGSKSKIAHLYPAPKHDVVIEPFAGSAAYSALHCERQVHINEKDDVTASVWKFLLRVDAMECVERWFPKGEIKQGMQIVDLFPVDVDRGFVNLIRAEYGQGAFGLSGTRVAVSPWGARDAAQVRDRIEFWIPLIKHWTLTTLNYAEITNRNATWFIDPPYNNAAGSIYRTSGLNYSKLAKWCMEREGQVTVCENEGATWLPFRFLVKRMGSFTGRDDMAKASGGEVVWEKGIDPMIDVPDETDALAFALSSVHSTEAAHGVTLDPVLATEPSLPAADPQRDRRIAATRLADALEARGIHLLKRDDKLFTTNSSKLTDEDRAAIKAIKEDLLPLAEHWPVAEVTSLASFLGNAPSMSTSDWTAQSPPENLPDDIILNFETNGLNWAGGDEPIGVTVGTLDGQLTRYLPFAHRGGGNLDRSAVIRFLQDLRGKNILNANTRFDVHMGRNIDVDFEAQGCGVSDIMHWAALLDDHRKKFALDVLARDYLGGIEVERVDERNMADYSAADVVKRAEYQAVLVARLREKMLPQIQEQGLTDVLALENETIYPVVEMEKNGSQLNLELLEKYHLECGTRHDDLMWEISREVGFAFEHTASGWTRLLEHLRLSVPDSFAENVLDAYDHPTVRKAQRAAQYASLNSKTFAAYKEHVGPDGILRYDINQLKGEKGGTVSGRMSTSHINQCPNHDNHHAAFGEGDVDVCHGACDLFPRAVFVAADGHDYLYADAMQIEFRLLAHFMQNAKILQAYRDDPLMSFHKTTWAMIKQYKPDMLYTPMKSFNFARQYGARLAKLAMMMGFITEAEMMEIRAAKRWKDPRLDQIREIEAAYAKMLPEGDALLDKASHLAKSECDDYCKRGDALHRQFRHRGYVKTIMGRRSRFPNNYKTYIGLNRVLQGSGAEILKKKLVELHKARKWTGFVMRLPLHDAVGGDATTPETKDRVAEILNAQSFDLRVPILWSVGVGRSWAEAK